MRLRDIFSTFGFYKLWCQFACQRHEGILTMDGTRLFRYVRGSCDAFQGDRCMGIWDDCICTPPFVFILVFLLIIFNAQELLTKQIPYAHFKLDPQVLLAIINYDLPPLPESSKTESQFLLDDFLWRICMRCWQRIPEERPHMRDVILWLNMSSVSSIETGEVGFIPSYDCMGSI